MASGAIRLQVLQLGKHDTRGSCADRNVIRIGVIIKD